MYSLEQRPDSSYLDQAETVEAVDQEQPALVPDLFGPGDGSAATAVEAFGHYAEPAGQMSATGGLADRLEPVEMDDGSGWFGDFELGPGYGNGVDGWGLSRESVPLWGLDAPGLSGGFSFGESWQQMARDWFGMDVSSDGHMADFNAGFWEDDHDPGEASPDVRFGGRAALTNFNEDGAQLGNMSAEAFVGTDGFSIGAGVVGLGGATQMEEFSAEDDNETKTQFGGSANKGLGLRVHWDDSDSDGARELGFGFDYGWGSFDLKSEAIHNGIMDGGDAAMQAIADFFASDDQGLEPEPGAVPDPEIEF